MDKKLQIDLKKKQHIKYVIENQKSFFFAGYCPRYEINQNSFKESHKKKCLTIIVLPPIAINRFLPTLTFVTHMYIYTPHIQS